MATVNDQQPRQRQAAVAKVKAQQQGQEEDGSDKTVGASAGTSEVAATKHRVQWFDGFFRLSVLLRLAFIFPMVFITSYLLVRPASEVHAVVQRYQPSISQPIVEKDYADSCGLSDVYDKVVDPFVLAHFFGWMVNAMMARNASLTIIMSGIDELCELWWRSSYNNFRECWWDSIFLDLLICNSGGAIIGAWIMKRFFNSSRDYIREIPQDKWGRAWGYALNMCAMKVVNMFILFGFKSVLWIPPPHPINGYRMWAYAFLLEGSLSEVWRNIKEHRGGARAHSWTLLFWAAMLIDLAFVCKMGYHEPVLARMGTAARALFVAGVLLSLASFRVFFQKKA